MTRRPLSPPRRSDDSKGDPFSDTTRRRCPDSPLTLLTAADSTRPRSRFNFLTPRVPSGGAVSATGDHAVRRYPLYPLRRAADSGQSSSPGTGATAHH